VTQFLLANDVLVGAVLMRAGKKIDDGVVNVATIVAAGGQLVPFDPILQSQLARQVRRGARSPLDPASPAPGGQLAQGEVVRWQPTANGRVNSYGGEVVTVNATPVPIPFDLDGEIPTGSTFAADVAVVAASGADQAKFTISGLFTLAGGVLAQVGATQKPAGIASGGAGAWAADFALDADTDVLDVSVTGAAATTIKWFLVLQISVRS
jgi:hypothetical protein